MVVRHIVEGEEGGSKIFPDFLVYVSRSDPESKEMLHVVILSISS